MAELATAWVNIVPSMKGAAATIARQLGDVDTKAIGSRLGGNLGGGILDAASTGVTRLGGLLSGIGKTAAGAIATAVPAIGMLGKTALDSYAQWEQAVGGVDTLFKDASSKVQQYAADAYKTAGVSANSYMNQVTSFAASLISSLGGDTQAAADMANTALTDMSDNANKMGTDLELIQGTYQSLARGNYAMLDNLKLGYGGTKTELERLIADANKLAQAQGLAGDLSIDSFADVVQAIHLVQQNLGITGTTAREAATTIEGSVGSMKAAWSNWLTELGKDDADMSGLTSQLIQSATTAAGNIAPRIGQILIGALDGAADALTQLGDRIPEPIRNAIPAIQSLADALQTGAITIDDIIGKATTLAGALAGITLIGGNAGGIIDAFTGIGTVIDSITGKTSTGIDRIKAITGAAGSLFDDLGTRWGNALGIVDQNFGGIFGIMSNRIRDGLTGAGSTLTGLFDSRIYLPAQQFGNRLAQPFKALAGRVGGFMAPVTGAFGTAFQGFGSTLGNAAQAALGKVGGIFTTFFKPANFLKIMGVAGIAAALVAALGALDQTMGGQLAATVGTFLTTSLPVMLAGFQAWIAGSLPGLITSGAQLLTAVITGLTTAMPQLVATAVTLVATLVNGLATQLPTLIPAALTMVTTLAGSLLANVGQLVDSGMRLLLGLVQGLVNAIPQLIAQIPTIIGNFANGIASNLPRIVQTGIQILTSLAEGLASAVPQLIAQIPAIVGQLWNAFTSVDWLDVGTSIITGIAKGVAGAAGKLVDAAVNAAKNALDWVKSKLGIGSPSRVFARQVGRWIPAGMAQGITGNLKTVRQAGERMNAAVLDAQDAPAALIADAMRRPTPTAPYPHAAGAPAPSTGARGPYTPTYNITANDPSLVIAKIDARDRVAALRYGGLE